MSFDLNTLKKEKSSAFKNKTVTHNSFFISKSFSDKKKERFYRELGLLLKSGVDFKKALEIMGNQAESTQESALFLEIKEKVVHGKSIYESMRNSGQFSSYEYYSIQIGEETRQLEQVLAALQKYFNRKIQMRRQIISVLTYPAIVLLVTISVLYFMLNKVVPMFSSVFKQFGSELPKSTQIILKISHHSGFLFLFFFGLLGSLIAIHYTCKTNDKYQYLTSKWMLKIPFFGNLIRKIYLSRFCQSMNLLLGSKTTLLNSLGLTSKMIGFYPITFALSEIKNDITKGVSLSESMKKHAVFEPKMVSMIEVAEQINELDSMFEQLSEQYNDEINHQSKMIGVVLEPMIIIFIGIIVGIIMISMYAPMFDLSKIIKR